MKEERKRLKKERKKRNRKRKRDIGFLDRKKDWI